MTQMLYGTNNAPARMFFKMAVVLLLLPVVGVRIAFAANTGAAPQLVPYMQYLVAGNSSVGELSGFGGDNGPAVSATMSAAQTVAVDSAGNIYFPDLSRMRSSVRSMRRRGSLRRLAGRHRLVVRASAALQFTPAAQMGLPLWGRTLELQLMALRSTDTAMCFSSTGRQIPPRSSIAVELRWRPLSSWSIQAE